VRTSNLSKSNVIIVKRMMNGKNHRRGQSTGTSLQQKMLIALIKPDRGATEMTIRLHPQLEHREGEYFKMDRGLLGAIHSLYLIPKKTRLVLKQA
jgi:hypothetical protein